MYTRCVQTISFTTFCRALASVIAVLMLSPVLTQRATASDEPKTSSVTPLPLDDVIDNLVRGNAERSRNLLHSEATRVYHLTYHGFLGSREAEMTVEASYDSPSSKEFKVVSESGSKIILDRVLKKLLEAEKESVQPQIASQTKLNRQNYEFALVGYDAAEGQYELQVTPKHNSKYVYRGKIWVDTTDFAVTRIEAEPAQNPSFWTRKSEVHQEYEKVEDSWVPLRNESTSYIRLGGRATLTIEYKNYRLTEAHTDVAAVRPSAERVASSH